MSEMGEKTDAELLREYATNGHESAFRELVTRYTDLVYSAALRQLESADLAGDITQGVFLDLARKARPVNERLAAHNSLAGWLHRSTRYAVLNYLRDTRRRISNERQAMEQLLNNAESSVDWELIRPALDEALDSLGDEDREALLLRYFKNQDLRTVGASLGVSDDAAQKRVSRAVERLREFFTKRGVTIGAGGLVAVVSANAVQAAPVGLAATISAAALVGTAATASTVIAATTKTIAMTTLQKAIVTAALAAAVGTAIYEARQNSHLRENVRTAEQQQADQLEQFKREQEQATATLVALRAENDRLGSNSNELLRLRSAISRLRESGRPDAAPQEPAIPPLPNGQPADTELPKDSWADAGFGTPEAALRTRGWSVLTGNRERFKQSVFVTDEARQSLENMFVRMAEASNDPNKAQFLGQIIKDQFGVEDGFLMPMMAENRDKGYTGYRILSQESPTADEMILQVETAMSTAPAKQETLKFRCFDGAWKVVIDEAFLKSKGIR